jgi:23S rRNA (cytidine1920-2'-O)/16S rRNA (cytidine1409-2'-O)-methyltransferase
MDFSSFMLSRDRLWTTTNSDYLPLIERIDHTVATASRQNRGLSEDLKNEGWGKMAKKVKERLDRLLVDRALVESREQGRRLIMAGEVLVDEQVVDKPGQPVLIDAGIRVRAQLKYVSRGGLKLEAALDEFALDVTGLSAVDVGASTGGFTDCLLQRGAARVYAVDVGYGQLAWKLRQDERVITLERTNIRHLDALPGGVLVDLAVIDASFIGLSLVLPPTLHLLAPHGMVIALIKPQFEAGRHNVGKGGVVRDRKIHRQVIEDAIALAHAHSLRIAGLTVSPAPGPAGNIEFLIWMRPGGDEIDLSQAIEQTLAKADTL